MKNLIILLVVVSLFISCKKIETSTVENISGKWHHVILDGNIFSISDIYFSDTLDSLTGQVFRYVWFDSTGTKVDTTVALYTEIFNAKRDRNKINFSWYENGPIAKGNKYVFKGMINDDFNEMNGTYYIDKTYIIGKWNAQKF